MWAGKEGSVNRFWVGLLASVVMSAAVGCDVDLQEGVYQCDLDGPRGCPPGWVCSLRPEDQAPRCYREPQHLCGNGVLEVTEACDGTDFGGQTCATMTEGLSQGQLTCNDDCTMDLSACHLCGNGSVEGPETCDGSDLAGGTCWTVAQKKDGLLSCGADCQYDTSLCHDCGNGIQEAGEDCDGDDLGDASCATVGDDGGSLACQDDCTFDRSRCFRCGDGTCSVGLGENASQCSAECGWSLVAAGAYHTCGILGDGTVWCWGVNDKGQLGDGTLTNSASPVHVVALPSAADDLSAGRSHSCAVLSDGSLWCWGDNASGQIGPDVDSSTATPQALLGLDGAVAQVACGDDFTCVRMTQDDSVWCWGSNAQGQLGDESGQDSATPVSVSLTAGALDIAAGARHACAVLTDGSVWCWGDNRAGQVVGDGQPSHAGPQQVHLASQALSVAPGDRHTCSLLQGGDIWCWGDNADGALGDGTRDATNVPVLVQSGSSAAALSSGTSFSCAVLGDHRVWCWGSNDSGRLGIGATDPSVSATPLQVIEIDDARVVSTGFAHVCSIFGVGLLRCWGDNEYGQLGDGSTNDSATPVPLLDSRFWQE